MKRKYFIGFIFSHTYTLFTDTCLNKEFISVHSRRLSGDWYSGVHLKSNRFIYGGNIRVFVCMAIVLLKCNIQN